MKRVLYILGVITILLLIFDITGWLDEDDIKNALRKGNRLYESAEYDEALAAYESGLMISPMNTALNYNAAQTAYLLYEYEKAAQYYERSEDSIEKYLNMGNIYFTAGEMAEDESRKAQSYFQAVQIYKEGILKFPKDVMLKYNYEIAKEKALEYTDNEEQESSSQDDGDKENESGNETGQDAGDKENESGNETGQDDGDKENESGNETGQDAGDEGESEDSNSRDIQEQGSENDIGYGNNDNSYEDQEAVERILKMLEDKERQSLKNNQEVIGGNDGKNGW